MAVKGQTKPNMSQHGKHAITVEIWFEKRLLIDSIDETLPVRHFCPSRPFSALFIYGIASHQVFHHSAPRQIYTTTNTAQSTGGIGTFHRDQTNSRQSVGVLAYFATPSPCPIRKPSALELAGEKREKTICPGCKPTTPKTKLAKSPHRAMTTPTTTMTQSPT